LRRGRSANHQMLATVARTPTTPAAGLAMLLEVLFSATWSTYPSRRPIGGRLNPGATVPQARIIKNRPWGTGIAERGAQDCFDASISRVRITLLLTTTLPFSRVPSKATS